MQPSRKHNPTPIEKPVTTKWFDESFKKAAVPVGPRFQAELPDWIGPPGKHILANKEKESDGSKWLGTQVWPIKDEAAPPLETDAKETMEDVGIGKGRPNFCHCESSGSVDCVRRHVADEKIKLQSELGPAFREWRFDEMGEEVANKWTLQEQREFESIVKRNPLSKGKSFLKAAMASLLSHNSHSILNYYFNVHLPRRIRKETSSGFETAATDDEETWEATNDRTSCRKKSRIIY